MRNLITRWMFAAIAGVVVMGASGVASGDVPVSWSVSQTTVTPPTAALSGISCPSPRFCVAAGDTNIFVSYDGGVRWTSHAAPDLVSNAAVSCATTEQCVIVDRNAIEATSDGGATWSSAQSSATVLDALVGVSCPSFNICYAVGWDLGGGGYVLQSFDGGRTWSSVTGLMEVKTASGNEFETPAAISCSTPMTCMVAGRIGSTANLVGAIMVTRNGGKHWALLAAPSISGTYLGVSCWSRFRCAAVAEVENAGWDLPMEVTSTANAGATWTLDPPQLGVVNPTAISCSSWAVCVAIGSNGPDSVVAAGGSVGDMEYSYNGGRTWHISEFSAVNAPGNGIACSQESCFVAGSDANSGAIFSTQNVAATWSNALFLGGPTLDSGAVFDTVACPSASQCVATQGDNFVTSSDGGRTWTTQPSPRMPTATTVNQVYALSCPSTSTCVAVGTQNQTSLGGLVLWSHDGGSSWTQVSVPSAVEELDGISCPTTSTCTAIGIESGTVQSVALETTDSGATWQSAALPQYEAYPFSDTPAGVSCPTVNDCVVTMQNGSIAATTDAGVAWTLSAPVAYAVYAAAVDCPDPSHCYAIGGYFDDPGDIAILFSSNEGLTWTSATLTGVQHPAGLSCTASTSCVLVTDSDEPLFATTNGSSWTAIPIPVSGVTSEGFFAVSCALNQGSCVAVGGANGPVGDGGFDLTLIAS